MKPQEYVKQHETADVSWMTKTAWWAGYTAAFFKNEIAAFELLESDTELSIGDKEISLSYPERQSLMHFLQAFGGNWSKELNTWDKTKMDYIQKIGDFTLKVVAVLPPPSCQIVEEDVLVPAQPERMEKRKVIKCPQPIEQIQEDVLETAQEGAVS